MQILGDLLFSGLLEGEKGFQWTRVEVWRALMIETQSAALPSTGALDTWSCLFYETETLNVG
jgi:hypothetical protein